MIGVYTSPEPLGRQEAERAFASGNADTVCRALLRVTLNYPDWRWVQDWCLRLYSYPDVNVKCLVATCLGHIARLHGHLDEEQVFPVLERLMQDPQTAGYGDDALDLITRSLEQETKAYKRLQRRYKKTLIPIKEA